MMALSDNENDTLVEELIAMLFNSQYVCMYVCNVM